jgi:hypothetical protein
LIGGGVSIDPASTSSHLALSSAPSGVPSLPVLASCLNSIRDQASPSACIQASTTPTLGRLFPISSNLFVAVGGNVGIGTTTPSARLHVSGTARVTDTLTLAPAGDVALDVSTGSIYKGGALFIHTKGGLRNTAFGRVALSNVTSGGYNTASGYGALNSNTTGHRNTASGDRALQDNTTGIRNTASGYAALSSNTTGGTNTAFGERALQDNTTGFFNTASGSEALGSNTSGNKNTANGVMALNFNTTGSRNTGSGYKALHSNLFGSNNVALGYWAGYWISDSDNIAIGNMGVGGESATIRIGTSGTHTRAFIAGIRGVTTGLANAIPVLVDSDGQLGTVSSSRRFKEEVQDMGERTQRLLELRPVVFRYKPEVQSGERPLEYGLIAEEVAEVFPELVVHDEDGQPFTVKYHLLSAMLLNELQRLDERFEAREGDHARELEELRMRLAALEARVGQPVAAVEPR